VVNLEPRDCVYHFQNTPRPSLSLSEDKLELQSDEAEEVMSGTTPAESTSTTVVEFLDETPGTSWSVASAPCTNLMDVQPDVDLSKYLSPLC